MHDIVDRKNERAGEFNQARGVDERETQLQLHGLELKNTKHKNVLAHFGSSAMTGVQQ